MFTGQSLFLSILICILFFVPNFSYSVDVPVKVNRIKFARENVLGLVDWYEIAIEIEGGRNPRSDAINPRFLDNVGIRLSLCYEVNTITGNDFRYFQSAVKIISIEREKKKISFFYLPTEIIQRDQLSSHPFAYLVEIELEGTTLALGAENISSTLRDSTRLFNFKARVASKAAEIAGVLMPIYHTPFNNLRKKLENSPSYFRE